MRCLGLEVSTAQRDAFFPRDGYLHQSRCVAVHHTGIRFRLCWRHRRTPSSRKCTSAEPVCQGFAKSAPSLRGRRVGARSSKRIRIGNGTASPQMTASCVPRLDRAAKCPRRAILQHSFHEPLINFIRKAQGEDGSTLGERLGGQLRGPLGNQSQGNAVFSPFSSNSRDRACGRRKTNAFVGGHIAMRLLAYQQNRHSGALRPYCEIKGEATHQRDDHVGDLRGHAR